MLGQGPNAAGRRGSIINVASLLSFQWVFSSPLSLESNQIESSDFVVLIFGVLKYVFYPF